MLIDDGVQGVRHLERADIDMWHQPIEPLRPEQSCR
jgi:hypothetical protein